MAEFTIGDVFVGGIEGRYDGWRLVQATVTIGPVQLQAYLDNGGNLHIDETLRDWGMRRDIGIELRRCALEALAIAWAEVDKEAACAAAYDNESRVSQARASR